MEESNRNVEVGRKEAQAGSHRKWAILHSLQYCKMRHAVWPAPRSREPRHDALKRTFHCNLPDHEAGTFIEHFNKAGYNKIWRQVTECRGWTTRSDHPLDLDLHDFMLENRHIIYSMLSMDPMASLFILLPD